MEVQIKNARFERGLAKANKLQGKIGQMIRDELHKGLGLKSKQALWLRAKGHTRNSPFEEHCITEVFARYGITDPWD